MKTIQILLLITISWAWSQSLSFAVDTHAGAPEESHAEADDILVDMDLSSSLECVPAALAFNNRKLRQQTITLDEGNNVRIISRSCMLTAGEFFAAKQVLSGQMQQLNLTRTGAVVVGKIRMDSDTAKHCRSLRIGHNITVEQDLGKQSVFSLPGSLSVAGSYSLTGYSGSCTLKAQHVHIEPEGTITYSSINGDGKLTLAAADSVKLLDSSRNREKQLPLPTGIPTSKSAQYTTNHLSDGLASVGGDLGITTGEYELKKVRRTLVHQNDNELIPVEGTSSPLVGALETQERQSCQPKKQSGTSTPPTARLNQANKAKNPDSK